MPKGLTLDHFYETRGYLKDEGLPYRAEDLAAALEVSVEDIEAVMEIAEQYEKTYNRTVKL